MAKLKGHYTLQEYADIVAKDRKEIRKLEEELKEAQSECERLRGEVDRLKTSHILLSTEGDEVTKQILKFHAQSYNVVEILNKLIELGIQYEVDGITRVVNNIDLLSSELQLYYKKEVESFEESVKINPNILKEALIRDNQFLINEIRKLIETTQNEEEKLKYFDRYDKFINTRTKLLSEVVIDDKEDATTVNIVSNMMDDYEEQKSNIIKLNLDSIKVI